VVEARNRLTATDHLKGAQGQLNDFCGACFDLLFSNYEFGGLRVHF
jgi:hypothetical protein